MVALYIFIFYFMLIISRGKSCRKSVRHFEMMLVKMRAETEMRSVCVQHSSSRVCPFSCLPLLAFWEPTPLSHLGLCVIFDCMQINWAACQMWQLLIKMLTNDLSPWNCQQWKCTFYPPSAHLLSPPGAGFAQLLVCRLLRGLHQSYASV